MWCLCLVNNQIQGKKKKRTEKQELLTTERSRFFLCGSFNCTGHHVIRDSLPFFRLLFPSLPVHLFHPVFIVHFKYVVFPRVFSSNCLLFILPCSLRRLRYKTLYPLYLLMRWCCKAIHWIELNYVTSSFGSNRSGSHLSGSHYNCSLSNAFVKLLARIRHCLSTFIHERPTGV